MNASEAAKHALGLASELLSGYKHENTRIEEIKRRKTKSGDGIWDITVSLCGPGNTFAYKLVSFRSGGALVSISDRRMF